MRQSNIFKKIFRLQAHLLKRKRTNKWIQKRIYYNKRERILTRDIKLFEESLCIKSYVDRLKKLQNNIYKNTNDPVEQKKQKVFKKQRNIDLIIKIRHIITGLKARYLEQKLKNKIKLPSNQILRWLTKYFKNQKDTQYLNKYPFKLKKRVYNAISTLIKQRLFVSEDQNYIAAEQWYKKFISQCRPYVDQQLANTTCNKFDQPYYIVIQQESKNNEENELQIFNNSQGTIQFQQSLKQIPRRGKIIQKMMVKLQNQFQQEKQRKMGEKPLAVVPLPENKVLRLKKPRCPLAECKNELSVRKCPDANHMITICEECHWNQHICVNVMPESYLQQMHIVAKGERIRNFALVRLTKTEKENNLKETLKKLNYEYTDKIKILAGTPQKIICSYPRLAFNAYNQILKNRQEQCFLPLTIKQSVIEGAGLGVFAAVDIKKIGTLVCSYLGQIGIGSQTPVLSKNGPQQKINDSIFTLGWIEKQLFLMIPHKYTNIGRFINYNDPNLCNLKPSLCLIEKEVQKYEIAVFLTTTKQILKGEQLYYNYGSEYNL